MYVCGFRFLLFYIASSVGLEEQNILYVPHCVYLNLCFILKLMRTRLEQLKQEMQNMVWIIFLFFFLSLCVGRGLRKWVWANNVGSCLSIWWHSSSLLYSLQKASFPGFETLNTFYLLGTRSWGFKRRSETNDGIVQRVSVFSLMESLVKSCLQFIAASLSAILGCHFLFIKCYGLFQVLSSDTDLLATAFGSMFDYNCFSCSHLVCACPGI